MTRPATLPHTEVFDLRSAHAEADFQIRVATPVPGMMPLPPGPRDVLYLLDADLFFGTAVETTRLMAQLFGELPPLLVVGIGYDTPSPRIQAELRARDFTPTADAGFEAMARGLPGAPEPTLPEGRRLGRAPHFLEFLTREVKPFVEDRYEVEGRTSILFGSSLAGLFTVHTLLERPEPFDAYVAVSPALWWDDGLLLRREEATAVARADLDARLFLAAGSEEERADVPGLAAFRLVSNVHALADALRSRDHPSLRVRTLVAEGESHTTVVPVALTRALRWILGAGGP